MSATDFGWVFAAISLGSIAANFSLIVFLFTKWRRFPRPTGWALAAMLTFLAAQIGMQVGMIILAQFSVTESLIWNQAIATLLSSILHFAGLCILITAVYVDRAPKRFESDGQIADDRSRPLDPDPNPYAV